MTDKKQLEALELASAAESAGDADCPTAKKANAYYLCLLEDCVHMIRKQFAISTHIPGVQWQCGPQASGFTTPQPAPQPSPASQGDALDAEQHEMDARHAAIYRWMLSHAADVFSIFDNWLADDEADMDELHDVLAARAAQKGGA